MYQSGGLDSRDGFGILAVGDRFARPVERQMFLCGLISSEHAGADGSAIRVYGRANFAENEHRLGKSGQSGLGSRPAASSGVIVRSVGFAYGCLAKSLHLY